MTADIKKDILGSFRQLPAYGDVREAINLLKDHNINVIAVTNSSDEMVKEQLTHSDLIDLVDSYYSVDSVEKYKPFEDIYRYVLNEENIKANETVMVAAHDWDLFGAKKAGLHTAYIKRKKDQYNPYYFKPDLSNSSLVDLARYITKFN